MSDPYDLAPLPPPEPMEVLPVEPIGYSTPMDGGGGGGRPGIMTAVGVSSIVLASLGIVVGGWISSKMITMASAISVASRVAAAPPAVAATPAVANGRELLSASGMSADQRQIVLDGLNRVRPLSDQRRRLVDELLAEDGAQIISFAGDSLTGDRVVANVSDSGRLLTSHGGDDGPEFFVFGPGRLEVSDDHAVFYATDGSAPVRVTADSLADVGADASGSSLSERQIQSVVRRINFLGGRLTRPQITTLTQTLQNPNEQLVVPTANDSDPAAEVTGVSTGDDGSVTIISLHNNATSMITLGADGRVNSSMTSSARGFGAGQNPFGKVSPATPEVAVLLAIMSFGVAVYLLICGIMVLRHSPSAARLHWIYVALKIPLEILSIVAIWWVFSQIVSGFPGGAGRAPGIIFTGIFSVPCLLGCIYPVVLLFVLSSRDVRGYYSR